MTAVTVTLNFTNAQLAAFNRAVQDNGGDPDRTVQAIVVGQLGTWLERLRTEQLNSIKSVVDATIQASPDVAAQVQTLLAQAKALVGVQ